jgi:RsiW-degrading membrane proteinase PrsW (M82 family)
MPPAPGPGTPSPPALPPHPPWAQQPARRRTWLTVVTSVVLGIGALVVAGLILLTRGPEATVVGFTLAALPVPFLVGGFLWLDRYEPEPWRYLLAALGWGAVMATTLGVLFTTVGSELSGTSASLDGVLWAPVTEELSKGLFIVLVVLLRRHEVDGVLDGIVYAGMAGIGFAFTENILYYIAVYDGQALQQGAGGGPGGLAAATGLFIVRGVMSPFAHPLFTAGIGIGMGLALRSRTWVGRLGWPVLGYLVAVTLHAAWNGSALLGGGGAFLLTYVGVMLPAFALAVGVALWVRRREGRVLTMALQDCARRGWLHPAEVPWIASLGHRGTARLYARRMRGPFGARAVKEYQQAVAEMGFLHHRVMRGRAPRDVQGRAQEIRRRIALWRPHVVLPPPLPGPRVLRR